MDSIKKYVPRFVSIKEKKFIGMKTTTSLLEDQTFKLFSSFMPRKKELKNIVNKDVLDIRLYSEDYYLNFNPKNTFVKCAMIEVDTFNIIPDKMESLIVEKGDYAVFKINDLNDKSVFQYIFSSWIPNSNYNLDNRPHFDVFNEDYQMKKKEAFYEIYIPIKPK